MTSFEVTCVEGLVNWLNCLLGTKIQTVDNLFNSIENGVLLCEMANQIGKKKTFNMIKYKADAETQSFKARDNVLKFITWCRDSLSVRDCLMFETDDLILRKNRKNVLLCLMEVKRLCKIEKLDSIATAIEEIAEEPVHKQLNDMVETCKCREAFKLTKIDDGNGKYRVGNTNTTVLIRILEKQTMIRIGGGWIELQDYLSKHNPCRCDEQKTSLNKPATAVSSKKSDLATETHKVRLPLAEIKPRAILNKPQQQKLDTRLSKLKTVLKPNSSKQVKRLSNSKIQTTTTNKISKQKHLR